MIWRKENKDLKLVIASHGKLASGFRSSLEILIGEVKNIFFFDAYCDEKDCYTELKRFMDLQHQGEQIILLSDVYGGSVNQVMYQFLERENVILISGINLPLVLELALKTDDLEVDVLEQIIQDSRNSLKRVELLVDEVEPDDFL